MFSRIMNPDSNGKAAGQAYVVKTSTDNLASNTKVRALPQSWQIYGHTRWVARDISLYLKPDKLLGNQAPRASFPNDRSTGEMCSPTEEHWRSLEHTMIRLEMRKARVSPPRETASPAQHGPHKASAGRGPSSFENGNREIAGDGQCARMGACLLSIGFAQSVRQTSCDAQVHSGAFQGESERCNEPRDGIAPVDWHLSVRTAEELL